MSLVKPVYDSVINLSLPLDGTQRGLAPELLTGSALFDSKNVFLYKGKLRNRPGLRKYNNTVFNAPVIGGGFFNTPQKNILLAFTQSHLYFLEDIGTVWIQTNPSTYGFNASLLDTTPLQVGTEYYIVVANRNYSLKLYTVSSATISDINLAPSCFSVCTVGSRIVGLTNSNTLRWTPVGNPLSWPALNSADISQTGDAAVAVRAYGTLDFVVYKERSIFVGKAQAGSDARAFNISFKQKVEGPAGLHAVVDINGTHFYMTKSGRVGVFNGTSLVQWIADGLWQYLQEIIDPEYAWKIIGVFDYKLNFLTFFFPRIGDNGLNKGMLIINLPLAGTVVSKPTCFIGETESAINFAYDIRPRNKADQSLLFNESDKISQYFDVDYNTDNETLYNCAFQSGLFALAEIDYSAVAVEHYFQRLGTENAVTMFPVVSDALETENGEILAAQKQVIDLKFNPFQRYESFALKTRFFGLRYEWLSSSPVRYGGTRIFVKKV